MVNPDESIVLRGLIKMPYNMVAETSLQTSENTVKIKT
jgi:hypothetical protein